jgi:hypothetical protein
MTATQSSADSATTCASIEEVARIIARLRECGARVLNQKGEDIGPGDIEELLKEGLL